MNVHDMVEKQEKKVGVKDIAAKAGVSIGTVDRVLHNRGEVKEETRIRILSIVEELGYKPNLLAKSLSTKKITRIAIAIPDSSDNNPYWEKPIEGIKKAAEELVRYNTEVNYVFFDASSEESFERVLREICNGDPDGVVLNPVFKSISRRFIQIFGERNIPFVFIDVNMKEVDNLGYFGQDAEQSGLVAARLMCASLSGPSDVLILKQTNKKIFSHHIESRITGFHRYLHEHGYDEEIRTTVIEIDLLEKDEPNRTLRQIFNKDRHFAGIFVPNSRAFKLADYLSAYRQGNPVVIGYDLVDKNVFHLEEGTITYLICQKPEVQAYNAIYALFDHLITKNEVNKTNYSPIDIIIKENLNYYLKV